MTSVDNLFPSKYLKAADLGNQSWNLIMERVEMVDMDDGTKPVLFFQGAKKGLMLNKTNANRIAHNHGKNMEAWWGRAISLHVEHVDFKGDIVPAIRVVIEQERTPAPLPDNRPVAPPAPSQGAGPGDMDDEIPF